MCIRALIVAYLIAAASMLIVTPAQAAQATVYIYKLYFDSPGTDTGSNTSLNAQYVVIKNGDNLAHSVSGWTVRIRLDTCTSSATSSLGRSIEVRTSSLGIV